MTLTSFLSYLFFIQKFFSISILVSLKILSLKNKKVGKLYSILFNRCEVTRIMVRFHNTSKYPFFLILSSSNAENINSHIVENDLSKETREPLVFGSSGVIFIIDILISTNLTEIYTLFQEIRINSYI